MKKTNIVSGLVLIVLAAYLLLNKIGILPDIAWFKLIVTLLLGCLVVKSIPKWNFFGIIMPLCILGCIYDKQLGIEAITPGTLIIAGLLLSCGLGMIFKKPKYIEVHGQGEFSETTINQEDGRIIRFRNSFNSVSKYVNTDAFSEAHIENSFGGCNVYFNNAIIIGGVATIRLENSFGQMNVYFPKTWRMELDRDVSFGNLKIVGEPNADMDAPCVRVKAESDFGNLNIFFE